jgi:hypothetical protein
VPHGDAMPPLRGLPARRQQSLQDLRQVEQLLADGPEADPGADLGDAHPDEVVVLQVRQQLGGDVLRLEGLQVLQQARLLQDGRKGRPAASGCRAQA